MPEAGAEVTATPFTSSARKASAGPSPSFTTMPEVMQTSAKSTLITAS